MKKSILSLLVIIFAILMAHGSTIGSWKAYMAYHDIMDVKKVVTPSMFLLLMVFILIVPLITVCLCMTK